MSKLPITKERFRQDFSTFWNKFLKPWSLDMPSEQVKELADPEDEVGTLLYGCSITFPYTTFTPSNEEAKYTFNEVYKRISNIYDAYASENKEVMKKAVDDYYNFAYSIEPKTFSKSFIVAMTGVFDEYFAENAS